MADAGTIQSPTWVHEQAQLDAIAAALQRCTIFYSPENNLWHPKLYNTAKELLKVCLIFYLPLSTDTHNGTNIVDSY